MVRYLIIILFFLAPLASSAQTTADYQKVMGKFVKYYNSKKGDSIVHLFMPRYRNDIKGLWTAPEMTKLHEKYGKIKSFKFKRLDPNNSNAADFRTVFSKIGSNGTGILLSKEKLIESFALITLDPNKVKEERRK